MFPRSIFVPIILFLSSCDNSLNLDALHREQKSRVVEKSFIYPYQKNVNNNNHTLAGVLHIWSSSTESIEESKEVPTATATATANSYVDNGANRTQQSYSFPKAQSYEFPKPVKQDVQINRVERRAGDKVELRPGDTSW
jgi:hypothetical protein